MKKKLLALFSIVVLSTELLAGCSSSGSVRFQEASEDEMETGGFSVAASCHDPQIVVGEDGTYYMFGSHMVAAESKDLKDWSYFANEVSEENPLFDNLLTGDMEAFSYVGKNTDGGYSVWAPDVVYNESMGKYVMYFCTTSSTTKSNLCMATADEIKGPYHYETTFLYSGFDQSNVELTNVEEVLGEGTDISSYLEYGGYDNNIWPNCIDPQVFTDASGEMWLTYGSWSGGIFVLPLDEETGLPDYTEVNTEEDTDDYFGTRILGGGNHSIEGPYIQYDEESGYYYLFVSYGSLVREGGYQIRQFRSENPDGPYVDTAGNTLEEQDDHFNYGLKMMGNYTFPSLNVAYMAPGGQSIFQDTDGKYYITYHQRFDNGEEYHEPRVHQLFQNGDGWFVAAPFATTGETLDEEGYETSDLQGTFYLVNHGTDISSNIQEAETYSFQKDGTIEGDDSLGTFEVSRGSSYLTIELDGLEYQGVLLTMEDEAGNDVFCFSAAGSSNETIWGVQYLKK